MGYTIKKLAVDLRLLHICFLDHFQAKRAILMVQNVYNIPCPKILPYNFFALSPKESKNLNPFMEFQWFPVCDYHFGEFIHPKFGVERIYRWL